MGTRARRWHRAVALSAGVVLCAGLFVTVAPVSARDLFFDDFESSPVGTLPAGWQIVYSGRGTSWQMVTDAVAASGTQSLHLWGVPGWSAVVQRNFASDSPLIGYRFEILLGQGAGDREHPGFYKHRAENYWGTYYAITYFWHASLEICSEYGVTLGSWSPQTWYDVRVLLDRVTHTYRLWIDGQLLGAGLPIDYAHPEWIDAVALTAGHGGVPIHYDDVAVFVPEPAEIAGLLADEVDALVAAESLNPGQAHALETKLVHALERLERGRTGPAMNQLRAFIQQVESLVAEGVLLVSEGDHLVRLAELMLEEMAAG